jgi:PIN domain nuclease of toxin-antitoxin system
VDGNGVIYLDTHVLVLLYLGAIDKLGAAARKAMEQQDLVVSPAAVLELDFLHEIRRLQPTAANLVNALSQDVGLRICGLPFRTVVEHALRENWGRDPFDRLIVANAKANDAVLVTRDEKIHQHYLRALW